MRQEFTCAMIMKMDCNSRANSNLFPSQNIHLVIFAISLYGFSTLRISRSDVLTIWRRRHERNLSSPYIQIIRALVDSKCYPNALLPDHGDCLVDIDEWGGNGHTD